MAAEPHDISTLMKSVREDVVMSTYSVAMIAGTVLMLGNMSRNLSLGNPLSIPHSVLYLAFLAIYLLRYRIGARWLAPLLLFALYLGGAFGYFIYGFIGNSAPLFMAMCIVAASFYGPRGGLIAAIAAFATMLTTAVLAMTGRLVFTFDMVAFVGNPFSWVAALTTFAAMATMALTQVGLMHRKLESLLSEQATRMQQLGEANTRLEQEIAARATAEQELRRQSLLLENILGSMPQGIGVFDDQLRLVLSNRGMSEVLGLPEGMAVRGISFDDLTRVPAQRGDYGPGDIEQLIAERRAIVMRQQPYSMEIVRPDGRARLITGNPFHVDGKFAGFIITYTDITQRKLAERELMRLHERFSLALKTAEVGIFDWNGERKEILADDRVFEIFGVSPDGRDGRFDDWTDYLHPEDSEETRLRMVASLKGADSDAKLSYRIIRQDGQVRHLEVHNHLVRGPDGRVQRLVGADFDVTARKEAEERLLMAEKVFDSSPVAIMITDSDNRIVSVNASFVRITGYAEAEAVGRDPKFLGSGLESEEFFAVMWQSLRDTDAWQGEIWDRRKSGEIYPKWMSINVVRDREHPGRINYLTIFSDITERKQAEQHIRHLAHHDALTTLPNRMELEARLEQSFAEATRNQCSVAVLFIDLDRFKTINDTLGHHVGDLLLIEVAGRLKASTRSSDTVARLGGDEFIVVLPALDSPDVATTMASLILGDLARPYSIEGKLLHSTPSIGVSLYPQDGSDVGTIMKYADTAMYHAKESGRNNFQFFSPELNRVAMERLDMERQLREALTSDQFVLHYQPRIDHQGRVRGVEALIRWNRPGHGLQLPGRFIPVAEESDLINLIGEWVLATAVRQLRQWLDRNVAVPAVAINLSARQLRQTGLPEQIAGVLEAGGVPPGLLEFELTESMTMENPDRAARLLHRLRKMGVAVALDDFGTGYSSLSYLKRLPFNYLKIDRSFVAEIQHEKSDMAIVKATVALAHSVGLMVVAEGVETEEQVALLKQVGCNEFQGYHFSHPLPAEELEAFLLRRMDPLS